MDYGEMTQLAEAMKDVVLRDVFAGHALQGMLSRPNSSPGRIGGIAYGSPEHYAAAAYVYADAMMEARKINGRT